MVAHAAHFHRNQSSASVKKIWDPSETLGIINPDPGYQRITCIGYAPSQRRRCRNPIRADNVAFITQTLNDIAYMSPDSPAVMSRLKGIAEPALCLRWHQGQAETVLGQWRRKIRALQVTKEERRLSGSSRRRETHDFVGGDSDSEEDDSEEEDSSDNDSGDNDSVNDDSTDDDSKDDLSGKLREMKSLLEAMAKLQEELNSQRHQDRGFKRREEERRRRRSEDQEKEAKRLEKELLQRERLEREYRERERLERERVERERVEKERVEKERVEKERVEKERVAKERLDKEVREREEKQRREREQAASNERIRQRAQKIQEDREREKRERVQKEREEWDQSWMRYQERWKHFRASTSRDGNIRDAIPWPVKSGSSSDVRMSNVKEFLEMAVLRDANISTILRKECIKWHPDKVCQWLRGSQLTDVDRIMIDMICRVITGLLNNSAGKSSVFLD